MAVISIQDLKLKIIVGTCAHERKVKQPVLVNISFQYDSSKAIKGDSLAAAVNYHDLVQQVIQMTAKTKFFLIEKLADFILKIVLKQPKITSATVRIEKPRALKSTKSVSAEVSGLK